MTCFLKLCFHILLCRYTTASGADESEVNIVGVNYTMTTSATLSGITAADVDDSTKTKLASAFAAAADLPAGAYTRSLFSST